VTSTARRGHHHKHSLSHQFFSFLEPGAANGTTDPSQMLTQPTPVPVSPWNPVSSFSDTASASATKVTFESTPSSTTSTNSNDHTHQIFHYTSSPNFLFSSSLSRIALIATIAQFLLGAWLWISGQQIGSLACTGLGYWVVFDAFGVGLGGVLPGFLAAGGSGKRGKVDVRRPYGYVVTFPSCTIVWYGSRPINPPTNEMHFASPETHG